MNEIIITSDPSRIGREPVQKPGRQPKPCDRCSVPVERVPLAGKQRRFCDACQLLHNRAKYKAHDSKRGWRRPSADPAKLKARARRWYANNREQERKKMLARYYAKAEQRRAAAREWKRANKKHVADHYAAWARLNRDAVNLIAQRRRARLRDGGSPGVTRREWSEIVECFDGRCAYCLGPASEIEHIVAISTGGLDEPSNVVPACKSCNASKGKKSLLQWLLTRGHA
jgi:5-methylcytosine-specific restriction endonuclease McrA